MGSGPSRDQQRRQQQQQQQQQQSFTMRGPPAGMPHHLLQHQNAAYQNSYQPPMVNAARINAPLQHPQPTNTAAAEVRDAQTISNPCTIHGKSIRFERGSLCFQVTTTVAQCSFEIHTAVKEFIRQGTVIFTPNRPKPPPTAIPIEGGPHDSKEISTQVDLRDLTSQEQEYVKRYSKQIPLAIVLKYTNAKGEAFIEYTYVQLQPKCQMVKQLLSYNGNVYLMEHLFGGQEEDGGPTVGAVVDPNDHSPTTSGVSPLAMEVNSEEPDCVVCLTNPKDTAVIPCRHLCLCKDCAEQLRRQSPKCPVCRGPIGQLLHMKKS